MERSRASFLVAVVDEMGTGTAPGAFRKYSTFPHLYLFPSLLRF